MACEGFVFHLQITEKHLLRLEAQFKFNKKKYNIENLLMKFYNGIYIIF